MNRRVYAMVVGVLVVLAIVAAVLLWAPASGEKAFIGERLEERIASGAETIDFNAEAPFAWDRMFVLPPYSTQADVEKALGFEWRGFRRTSIESSDSVCLVVFVSDKRVVGWYEQPRSIELAGLEDSGGYAREEAVFAVDRSGERVVLRKAEREATTRPG